MGQLVEYWSLLVAALCVAFGLYMTWRRFFGSPKEEQVQAIKQWLLYAVIEAEKELGSGTGKLKLRTVYDMFAARFPWAARTVPFDTFSVWVDEVLLEMRELLQSNEALKNYVLPWEEK